VTYRLENGVLAYLWTKLFDELPLPLLPRPVGGGVERWLNLPAKKLGRMMWKMGEEGRKIK